MALGKVTDDGWLTEAQAADHLGVSLATVKVLVRRGDLTMRLRHHQGGLRVEDVRRLLESWRIKPRSR